VISGTAAKKVFEEMSVSGKTPMEIVDEMGLAQVSDSSELEGIVDKIIADNPEEADAFRGGKTKLMGFFVGQVMKASGGKANPKIVNALINDKLK
jgi:aspartyl-tRNA(Asn)/glutamyl-tRNA(Gln) amidotransferase subunit B